MSEATNLRIECLLRELAPQALGAVMRQGNDFGAAEDAVQEALIAAADQWPRHGIPDKPLGWLVRVAGRRLVDYARSDISRRNREALAGAETPMEIAPEVYHEAENAGDETLVLLFMSCHPALTSASAIALTLRAVAGLTTSEIARAFLVPEPTIGQRISRAKQSIKASGIPFRMPDREDWAQRLSSVLHILYLVFNEGYTASSGAELHRTDLSNEAIRLTREVHRIAPNDPEVAGLLALMLLTDARRAARTGPNRELIPLDEQDRTRWDQRSIAEGVALVSAALGQGLAGEYQLQAAIAALHDEAASAEETDWPQILALYSVLKRMTDNPMAAISHAIATAMVAGPNAGLALLDPLVTENDGKATIGSTQRAHTYWSARVRCVPRTSFIDRRLRKRRARQSEIISS